MSTNELDDRIARLPPEKRALLELRLLKDRRTALPRAISRRAPGAPQTLSFAQQRLWFLDRLEPGTPLYNIPEAFRLEGPLDQPVLEKALAEILRRHDVLRTSFPAPDGNPVPNVSDVPREALSVLDVSCLPAREREAETERLVREEAARPFDLSRGPLFRASLLRRVADDHILLLTMHHIVSDGWSVGLLLTELSLLYEAFREGRGSPLPEPPIQYADFAAWQREWLTGEVLERELSYWKRELAGEIPVLDLPSDNPRPAVRTFRGGERRKELPQGLTEALLVLSRREGATLFMTLLGAYALLLSRYSGAEEVLVGSPIAGRNRIETEGLIGFFVNTLVLRADLRGDPLFSEFLARLREGALEAYTHQDLPFEKLVEEINPERSLSHTPLFGAMFSLENTPEAELALAGLSVKPVDIENRTAKFDLTLAMRVANGRLFASLEYNADLFEAATAERMLSHYRALLEAIVSDPGSRLSRLRMLRPEERHWLIEEWNETAAAFPRDTLLHGLFEEQAERTPDSPAVEFDRKRRSYGELNAEANRLARRLLTLGVGPEIPVGVCMERSQETVVALLAILKAGGAYVPLDPSHPKERLSFLLEDSGASVVVTQRRLLETLPARRGKALCVDAEAKSLSRESGENLPKGAVAPNLAYVIYTSGSTGRPKGVMVTHRNVVASTAARMAYYTGPACGFLLLSPFGFDSSVAGIFSTLSLGGVLHLPALRARQDPVEILRHVAREEVTRLLCVPSLWAYVLEEANRTGEAPLRSLREVIVAGETCPSSLARAHGALLPGVLLYNEYGPTEATVWSTAYRSGTEPEGATVPIGRPVANARVYVLAPQGEPVPVGVHGEIFIGGTGISRGYRNLPDLTAAKFLPDPFAGEAGARLYRTGDRGRFLPGGDLEFCGRLDDQIKIHGFLVEPGEIETALLGHPGVRDAAVLVQEDTPGDRRLVAYVAADWKPEPAHRELRQFLTERLPDYMVPAAFVALPSLPRLLSGKVDRRSLPDPGTSRPDLERRYVPPKDEQELRLTRIWENVLGVAPIGSRDNFFDLGGHSLLAVRLFTRIKKATGKRLPLATLFKAPTVGQLAVLLREEGWSATWSSLVAIQPGGSRPPFYCVHAAGGNVLTYRDLARYLGPDQPVYGLQAVGLDGMRSPHDRIEDMAAHYLKEMLAFQPEGPYFLGGTSAGGLVAFEIARQLSALGEHVGVLALFDTWGPDYGKLLPNATRLRLKLYGIAERFDLHFGNLLVGGPRAKWNYIREKSNRLRRRVRRSFRRMRDFPLPPALREVESATRRAIESYVPDVYPGRLTLFRATKQPAGYYPDPTLGWSRVAQGGVEIYDIPGRHGALVYEPRIGVLAEQLTISLRKAQRGAQTS